MAVVFHEMFKVILSGEGGLDIPFIRVVSHRLKFRQTVDSSVLQNYTGRGWACQLEQIKPAGCATSGQGTNSKQARPSGQPEEREKNIPWKDDGFLSGQDRFQPGLCLPVERSVLIEGLDQEVRIEKDHLRNDSFRPSSLSSMASLTASALSQRNSCPSPMRKVL